MYEVIKDLLKKRMIERTFIKKEIERQQKINKEKHLAKRICGGKYAMNNISFNKEYTLGELLSMCLALKPTIMDDDGNTYYIDTFKIENNVAPMRMLHEDGGFYFRQGLCDSLIIMYGAVNGGLHEGGYCRLFCRILEMFDNKFKIYVDSVSYHR